MPLNRLENFIKNIEGRILYVNPNDLDSTDSISNDGNSLAQPFKTIQRALIEAARFSYVGGDNNDYIERTTILIYPGEHVIDNRPGFAIKPDSGNPNAATSVSPGGQESVAGQAQDTFSLNLTSNFDLTQEDNILYKFNSVNGGVIVPRGTSIVGLDLRKTKVRPKYVPNPIASYTEAPKSAIFRVTGACYFWQFSMFDGEGQVYTNRTSFKGVNDVSAPTFSHHKLTCFEYADGINKVVGYDNTDLEMYYAKLSNAFNAATTTKEIPGNDKFPINSEGFAPRRPEFEIVGAFLNDPVKISDFVSGDGTTLTPLCTVTTATKHGLNIGTPIRVRGITFGGNDEIAYNTTAVVQSVTSETKFTYLVTGSLSGLAGSVANGLSIANGTITVETDTVDGASPYIFNCSLRSVWGMNGMHADGSKATGFRSMVVAQFTGISLQKDDRAFVKYDKITREYSGIDVISSVPTGTALSSGSAAIDPDKAFHLDSDAIYRSKWDTCHIRMTNDAIMQIVSVFAIGYNRHFSTESGGDASITNANSNFGQISLNSDGFKKEAFAKDNTAYVTNIITPKAIPSEESEIDWFSIDPTKIKSVGISSHFYLDSFKNKNNKPPSLISGYRIGAKTDDILYIPLGERKNNTGITTYSVSVKMVDEYDSLSIANQKVAKGTSSSVKQYKVTSGPTNSIFTIGTHGLLNGESVRIFSDSADLPENIDAHQIYYAITKAGDDTLGTGEIKLASSITDAENNQEITLYKGSKLSIESRVHDKEAGDIGSPIQWDNDQKQWYVLVNNTDSSVTTTNPAYDKISSTANTDPLFSELNDTYVKRIEDSRSLDDKIYKLRVVVPKDVQDGKNPEESFIVQESSSTGVRKNDDFTISGISTADYNYNRNLRLIGSCSVLGDIVTVITEVPHDLKVGEILNIRNVTSSTNTSITNEGFQNLGYNGTFTVTAIDDIRTFKYSVTDVDGLVHNVGTFTNDITVRNTNLPRFERNDVGSNFYVYRNESIQQYIENQQDGIYHLYILNASNAVPDEFTDIKYSQNVVDLYPQLDRDNNNDNPPSAVSKAVNSPLGDVVTNYLKHSLTRETIDKTLQDFVNVPVISSVADNTTSATLTFTNETYHTISGIATGTISNAGASYNNGTYYNVKLLGTSSDPTPETSTWFGATATVVVAGQAITSVEVTNSGGGYSAGNLFFDRTVIGEGNDNAQYTIAAGGIFDNVGDVVQVTGIGTQPDCHYRITSVPNNRQISIAKTTGDHTPVVGQYVYHVGQSVEVQTNSSLFENGVTEFTTNLTSASTPTIPHGLSGGNRITILDKTTNNNLGDFTVLEDKSISAFTAKTVTILPGVDSLSNKNLLILKHGLASNNATSNSSNENLGSRGSFIYGKESLILQEAVNSGADDTTIKIKLKATSGIGTISKFPLGSYLQVDDEIMRISTSRLTGSANNEISVIRGALGSRKSSHDAYSLIEKIDLIPIEFRRPSIARASGHTFEYVGFGPGNYSTGLPQVQVKSLTEREEFLAQSQERSAGTVMYTGMNNRGDFFIGNKRINSATGQERTFDAPIPTVTGENPSRLSVIFDEVIAKERIIVEGGSSKQILSQFDGPVVFNNTVKFNDDVQFNGNIKMEGEFEVTDPEFDGATFSGQLKIKNDVRASFGEGKNAPTADWSPGDLEIYHDTTSGNSIINASESTLGQAHTGKLDIQKDGTSRIEVNESGSHLTGISTFNGDTNFIGANYNAGWDKSDNALEFADNAKLTFGDSSDLSIFHNGSDSYIEDAGTGALIFKSNIHSFRNAGDTQQLAKFNEGGAVELFHSNVRVLQTVGGLDLNGVKIEGELEVTGDITALTSDIRLKTDIESIDSPLDKVCKISGFTYRHNETAKVECNIDTGDQRFVGVSAQDVQQVLPEAVKSAPSNNEYLTVQYEKLVPLLIEAIKELKNEVDELKKGK